MKLCGMASKLTVCFLSIGLLLATSTFSVAASPDSNSFEIEPAQVRIDFKRPEEVQTRFKLSNPFSYELKFNLRLMQESSQFVNDNGIDVIYPTGEILVPAGGQEDIEISIRPGQEEDYSDSIIFELEQEVMEQRLQQTTYPIEIAVNSELASTKAKQQQELIIGAGAFSGAIVVLAAVFFVPWPKLRRKGRDKEE